ncbi:MAG: ROK family protein [Bacteroidota bacterium]
MKKLAVGIDIGGTNTVFGFVDEQGNCIAKSSIETAAYDNAVDFADVVSEHIMSIFKTLSDSEIIGIGIGAPNGNYYTGTIEFAPNLKWKGIVPLADLFKKHFDLPVLLTNDANAAAIGEMVYGNAKNMKDFIFITLGTGVGSGIVVNGEMVYGHDGFAGEIGHTITYPEGRLCGCGRKGCLEAYCSAKGIKATYLEILNGKCHPKGTSDEDITPKYIYDQALQGESAAIKTFEYTGEVLGLTLSNSVAYTSPEAIFIFGGISNAGDLIFTPLRKSFENNLLNIYKNKIKILPSGIKENDAAILGAASMIWKQVNN